MTAMKITGKLETITDEVCGGACAEDWTTTRATLDNFESGLLGKADSRKEVSGCTVLYWERRQVHGKGTRREDHYVVDFGKEHDFRGHLAI